MPPADPTRPLSPADTIEAAEPAVRDDLAALTSLAIGTAVVVSLYIGREVLVPMALAILLSFVLAPVVRLLRRAWLGRVPAVFVAVFLALGVILSLGGLIGTQISQLLPKVPQYAGTVDQKIVSVSGFITSNLSGVVNAVTRQAEHLGQPPAPAATPSPAPTLTPDRAARGASSAAPPPAKPLTVEMREPGLTPLQIAESILTPAASPLANTGIVVVVTIFILLQQADLRDRMIRLFGMQDLHRTTRALDDAVRRLSRYLVTQLGLNALFGTIIGCGLLVIGLPNPLLWGTLAALFRFVPYIGSVMAGVLPTALAASIEPGWGMAIASIALFATTEVVMGQFVDPLAYGRSTGLSPIAVVIAAIFWTWMWGPIGLILSTPLTVCLVVLGRHVKRLEFLDVLMGDRPALTPVESFYQRLLANDPDEALEYAENLLKEETLCTYYDEVAVKGLQLVANDAERGVLTAAQLSRIQKAMTRLIEDLGEHSETASPRAEDAATGTTTSTLARFVLADGAAQWTAAEPVLCIPGDGPLDALIAEILAQILRKADIGARVAPFAPVAREDVAALDTTGVAMICLCSLDVSLQTARLRHTIRRLRRLLPAPSVLAGLWLAEEALPAEPRANGAMNADFYAGSLREAANICLALAGSTRRRIPAPAAAAAPQAAPSPD